MEGDDFRPRRPSCPHFPVRAVAVPKNSAKLRSQEWLAGKFSRFEPDRKCLEYIINDRHGVQRSHSEDNGLTQKAT